jgi:hypothetical protein
LAPAFLLAACATREDNGVGVGFIAEFGELKAVRDTSFTPPDSTTDFHVSAPPIAIGASGTLSAGALPGYLARTFLRWDDAVLPDSGTVIDSAFVRVVALEGKPATDPPAQLAVHRVTSVWNENTLVRDSIPGFLAVASDTFTIDALAAGDTASFAISLAQFWTDRPDSNFGMVLLPLAGTASLVELGSQESTIAPTLTVTWGATDTSVVINATDDTFTLEATPDFVPLAGMPGRMTVARGIPARSLLRFALPGAGEVPGLSELSTVNRAEVILRVDQSASRLHEVKVGLQRVTGPWQADSTDVSSVLFGATSVGTASDSVVISVTLIVQEILQNENLGFQLRALDERPDADHVRFHAHDSEAPEKAPVLRIWYTPGDVGEAGP